MSGKGATHTSGATHVRPGQTIVASNTPSGGGGCEKQQSSGQKRKDDQHEPDHPTPLTPGEALKIAREALEKISDSNNDEHGLWRVAQQALDDTSNLAATEAASTPSGEIATWQERAKAENNWPCFSGDQVAPCMKSEIADLREWLTATGALPAGGSWVGERVSAPDKQEPTKYEYRMRPDWQENQWSEWTQCSKEACVEYAEASSKRDWIYETRALYAAKRALSS